MSTTLIILLTVGVLLLGGLLLLVLHGKSKLEKRESYDRAAEAASQPEDPFKEGVISSSDPRKIKVGNRVDVFGVPRAVRGTVFLNEDGYRWCEHYLETTDGERVYLSVEEDADLVVVLWTEVDTTLSPGARELNLDHYLYHLKERGTANYRAEGTTDLPVPSGNVKYFDYEGPDGRLLSFERFNNGKWEASTGMRVDPRVLTIYPTTV